MITHVKRFPSVLQRSHFIVAVLIVAVSLVSSCATKRHEVATTRTVTTLHEVQQPAPTTIDVSIVNAGDKPVSRIAIRVNALDASGQVVRTVTTPPLAQPIGPFGGRATFEAIMPRDRAVAGYHAVAVAQ